VARATVESPTTDKVGGDAGTENAQFRSYEDSRRNVSAFPIGS